MGSSSFYAWGSIFSSLTQIKKLIPFRVLIYFQFGKRGLIGIVKIYQTTLEFIGIKTYNLFYESLSLAIQTVTEARGLTL